MRLLPSSGRARRDRKPHIRLNFRLNVDLESDQEILGALEKCREGDRSSWIRAALLAHARRKAGGIITYEMPRPPADLKLPPPVIGMEDEDLSVGPGEGGGVTEPVVPDEEALQLASASSDHPFLPEVEEDTPDESLEAPSDIPADSSAAPRIKGIFG